MTDAQRLTLRASEIRQRLNEIAGLDGDAMNDETRAEGDRLGTEYRDVETRRRAAIIAEDAAVETTTTEVDTEARERVELRGRASLGRYLSAAFAGRAPDGVEGEFAAACGSAPGQIPLDLFEADRPVEMRADAVSPAGSTTGQTLAPIQPYVFAASIAGRLGITMPAVGSGSHSWARISTPLTAGAAAKGSARESTAAALTAVTASPRRISARLTVEAEDVAAIGTASFEPALRSNLQGALADAYDAQCVNGDGQAPNVHGLIPQLAAATAPTDVAGFDEFVAAFAGQIDGLWATTMRDVVMVANVDTYRLSAVTFRDDTGHKGDMSAADYLAAHTGGWSTAARMPATPTTGARAKVADAIVRRSGRSLLAAVHPVWGSMQIDDAYTDSASARRHVTLHVLVGDKVLIVQPDAYTRASFKVKA